MQNQNKERKEEKKKKEEKRKKEKKTNKNPKICKTQIPWNIMSVFKKFHILEQFEFGDF